MSKLKIPPPCPIQSPNRHNFISAMRMRPSCLPVIMACITRARATHCSSSHQHSRRLWSRWCLPPSLLLGLCVHRRLEWAWIGNELERLNVAHISEERRRLRQQDCLLNSDRTLKSVSVSICWVKLEQGGQATFGQNEKNQSRRVPSPNGPSMSLFHSHSN